MITWCITLAIVYFFDDMRLIIGVVRWIPESHRDETPQANYHQNYKKSDMVYIGPNFSEKPTNSPGESADRDADAAQAPHDGSAAGSGGGSGGWPEGQRQRRQQGKPKSSN